MPEERKSCFVIAPIGEEGSEIRNRSDQVFNHIITPAVAQCGYEAVRADHIAEPGIITSQIIEHLVKDDLVVADLTDHNPNVFYELAVRHVTRKPIVQIIREGDFIPFDVAQSRTIRLNHRDLDSVESCKRELAEQVRSTERDPENIDNPVSVSVDLMSLRESENPYEKSTAEMVSMLQEVLSRVKRMDQVQRAPTLDPRLIITAAELLDALRFALTVKEGEEPRIEDFQKALGFLRRLDEVIGTISYETLPLGRVIDPESTDFLPTLGKRPHLIWQRVRGKKRKNDSTQ